MILLLKRKKNGFTLVELLVVVFLSSVILGIAYFVIGNVINNAKDKAIALEKNSVIVSADLFMKENIGDINWSLIDGADNKSFVLISVSELINKGYLDSDQVKNDYLSMCVIVTRDNSSNSISSEEIVSNCDNDVLVVDIPRSGDICEDRVYNGEEQVITGEVFSNYSVRNNRGKNAGSYDVVISLSNNNMMWTDGTNSDKVVTCMIKKATPSFFVGIKDVDGNLINGMNAGKVGKSSLYVESDVDGKISAKSSVKKYVNVDLGDKVVYKDTVKEVNIDILASRKASTVVTFTLNPDNDNYKKVTAVFTVGEVNANSINVPECKIGDKLKYNGNNIDVIDNADKQAYRLSNNIATGAGTYKVVAKLNYGYVWKDGSFSDKEIDCYVENKEINVKLDDQGATSVVSPSEMVIRYSELPENLVSIPKREYVVTYIYKDALTADNLNPKTNTVTRVYGYKFDGFYSGKNGTGTKYIDGTGKGIAKFNIGNDTVLYANWVATKLEVPVVNAPSGYDSIYWTLSNNKSGDKVNVNKYYPTGNVTLYGWLLDTTAPVCNISVSGSKKDSSSNWYTSSVNVKYTCKDSGSGCKANSESVFSGVKLNKEGSFSYNNIYVIDNFGNKTKCTDKTVNIDWTRPSMNFSIAKDVNKDDTRYTTRTYSTVTDYGSGIYAVAISSCAYTNRYGTTVGSSNNASCYYYGVKQRLKHLLDYNSYLSGDYKTVYECNYGNCYGSVYSTYYDLSWGKSNLIIYSRDAAGNYTVYLTEQDYNNIGAFYAWDVTGEF